MVVDIVPYYVMEKVGESRIDQTESVDRAEQRSSDFVAREMARCKLEIGRFGESRTIESHCNK